MQVFILPGGSGRNDAHWYTWLARELRRRGVEAQVISQNRLSPVKRARQLQDRFTLDADTVVVGHSFGGLAALKWLELAKQQVAGLVLIDTSVKEVSELPQPGKFARIRLRYLRSWDWKLDLKRAAGFAGRGAVLSERRTEKSYPLWKAGQIKFASALKCQVVRGFGQKQHFTARQEPLVLKTVLRLLKQVS
jgi:pimeloyl-ACP methyl ester carboxylesterase